MEEFLKWLYRFTETYSWAWLLILGFCMVIVLFMFACWRGLKELIKVIMQDRTCPKSWHGFHSYETFKEYGMTSGRWGRTYRSRVKCKYCNREEDRESFEPKYDADEVSRITGI